MFGKNISYKIGLLIYSVLLAFVPLWLLWKTGVVYSGSDMQFHVNRIAEIADAIKHGQFLNITAIISGNAAGGIVNQFYPYLTLLPAALLKLVIHNNVTAYYMTLLFYNMATFLIAYYAFTKLAKNRQVGIWGATLASLSMYRLFSLLGTSGFGEFISIGLIPLVWLGYVKVVNEKKWATLYIGMTLLAYTHLLSFVMVVALLGVITLVRWLLSKQWPVQETVVFAKAGIATAVSWLPYLVPYLILTHQNHISNPYAALTLESLKSFTAYLFDYHFARGIGLSIVLANILLLLCWQKISRQTKVVWWVGVGLVALASTIFPWAAFTTTAIKVLQFPYRFLVIGSVLLAYTGGVGVVTLLADKARLYRIVWQIVLFGTIIGISLTSIHNYKQTVLSQYVTANKHTKTLNYAPFASYAVTDATFDKQTTLPFRTYGAYDYWLQETGTDVNFYFNEHEGVKKLANVGRTQRYAVKVARNADVEVPTMLYDGISYQVYLDGHQTTITKGPHGGIVVHASKGHHRIMIKVVTTLVQKLMVVIAFVPLGIIVWTNWQTKRKVK